MKERRNGQTRDTDSGGIEMRTLEKTDENSGEGPPL